VNTQLAVKGTRRKPEARRMAKSVQLLTREQRVQEAVKVIGKDGAHRADIEAIVDQVDKQCERSKRTRQWQGSTKQKLFAKRFGAALRKVVNMVRIAPSELFLPTGLGVAVNVAELGIDNEVFDREHFLRHLELLKWICGKYEKSKLGKPKPNADEKRLTVRAALYLIEKHDIKPTTTKTGKLCKLAAVLYGDPHADLQHQCRELLDQRKTGIRTVLVPR
jgi:hypothetical protein